MRAWSWFASLARVEHKAAVCGSACQWREPNAICNLGQGAVLSVAVTTVSHKKGVYPQNTRPSV